MLFDLALYWITEMQVWFYESVSGFGLGFINATYDAVDATRGAVNAAGTVVSPIMPGATMQGAITIVLTVIGVAIWFRFALWAYQRITGALAAIK